MIIERRSAYPDKIFVQFEEQDFDLRLPSGELAWCAALETIKLTFPYPEGEFSRVLAAWLIDKSDENLNKLHEIKRRYFEDKNQMSLM